MSESAGKTFRGLQEAYASIYANKSENLTEETIVSEVQEEQEFEINEEALCNLFINYLVVEGYVKTEEEALKMIPHIGEEWFNGIVNHLSLSEGFYSCVDSFIKEGHDLSSFTEEELFETYINETHSVLSEQLAGDMPGLGWLRGLTGIFGAGAASRAVQTKPRPYRTRPEGSAVDYGQMTLEKPKPKPTPVVKSKAEDPWASDRPSSQAARDAQLAAAKQSAQSTPAPGGGPPEDPEKENAAERALRRRAERKAEEQAKKEQRRQQQANQPQTANQRIADKFKEYAVDKALGAAEFAKTNIKRGASLPIGLALGGVGLAAGEKFGLAPVADHLSGGLYSQAKGAIKGLIQQNQKSPSQRFREAQKSVVPSGS
jgi:hypothetical protein